jgi:phosphate-selective porin OprO/OprP
MTNICSDKKSKKMKKLLTFSLFAFLLTSINAQITVNKFGKGIDITDPGSTFKMNLGFRFQTLMTNDWDVVNDDLSNITNHTSNFLIRRSRIKMKGFAFSPRLEYKVELALSNRDLAVVSEETRNTPGLVLDAVGKFEIVENLDLWFGQTKLPGNRERIVSSANLQFVDRSRLNSRFNADRDLGLQLHYKLALGKQVIKPIVSFTQGEGRNLTIGNPVGGYQYIGKMEWLPLGEFTSKGDYSSGDLKREATPKIAFTGAFAYNDRTIRSRDQLGDFMTNSEGDYMTFTTQRVFADVLFKYKGYSMMLEYANRSADQEVIVDPFTFEELGKVYTGEAYNIQMGYLFKNNWEVSGRYTFVDARETVAKNETHYTLGVSKFIVGHKLKYQTDISYINLIGKDDQLVYRMQFELHF